MEYQAQLSERLAFLKQPKKGFCAQSRNSDDATIKEAKNPFRSLYLGVASSSFNTGTETVFQSLGSKGYHHKNNNGYSSNKHRQYIEEQTVQSNTNTVKRTSEHTIKKYEF